MLIPLELQAQERIVPESSAQIKLSYAPLVKKVSPAVVNIYTRRTVASGYHNPFMNDPFFEQFFGRGLFGGRMRERVESALGSGVIVTADGLIVTNAHVVRGAQEITVGVADNREYEAELVLSDEASDLAVLQIKDQDAQFSHVTLKPSETLEVGDLVLAIGNPFGVGQTVTSGIVSAEGRSSLDINDYNFFIQTDAAINPGNSGGPLVSMDGGVVGINTAIFSRSGGSMGIGFAIPSEMVASVIAAVENGQTGEHGIVRPWLGVSAQNVTADIADGLGLQEPRGAIISHLHPASPLREAGAQVGDVVISVNERDIRDAPEMKFRMATVPIGQKAQAVLVRKGEEKTIMVQAIAPPEVPPREETVLDGRHILNGAIVANINPAVALELDLDMEETGVVVMEVPRGTYASRAVRPGDIILEVMGQKISAPADIDSAFQKSAQQGAAITIKRGKRVSRIFIR